MSTFISRAKLLKNFSNSRKSSPSRTPIKKQAKVQSLLDPSRLKPPPTQVASGGNIMTNALGTNTRINYGLSMQNASESNEQEPNETERTSPQNFSLQLDANEIISIGPGSNVI